MGTFSEPTEYPGAAGQSLTLAGPLLPWPTEGLRGGRLPIGWKVGVGWRLQGTLRKDPKVLSYAHWLSLQISQALASFGPPPKTGDCDIHDDMQQLADLPG